MYTIWVLILYFVFPELILNFQSGKYFLFIRSSLFIYEAQKLLYIAKVNCAQSKGTWINCFMGSRGWRWADLSSTEEKKTFIRSLGAKKCCQLAKCNLSIHEQEMLKYCRGQKRGTWVPVSLLVFKTVLVMSSVTNFSRINFFLILLFFWLYW